MVLTRVACGAVLLSGLAGLPAWAGNPAIRPGPPLDRPQNLQDDRQVFPRLIATDARERLARAIEEGNESDAEKLLERFPELARQTLNENRDTPLHLAAWRGQRRLVDVLLRSGAQVRVKNGNGQTPLHAAVRGGPFAVDPRGRVRFEWLPNLQVVRRLLEQGADPALPENDGRSPLHLAARCGSLDAVHELIAHGVPLSSKDRNGQTPMELARFNRQEAVAAYLSSLPRGQGIMKKIE